jgi:hypothetical protein
MDVKGAQALKARIEAAPDNDSRPDVRLLVGSVGFLVQRQHETGRYDVAAAGEIDRFGHISLRRMVPHKLDAVSDYGEYEQWVAGRHDTMTEALLDEGLAEWRQVGPGETELYATQDLLRLVAPALSSLPGDWQRWPR